MNWDALHSQLRHQLQYPNEHVVRFLAGIKHGGGREVLDVGCGAGRHLRLARELGLDATGVDSSAVAVAACEGALVASMTELPFPDESFDGVLATGSVYYGTLTDLQQAVTEMHRVLRPDSWAFVTTRSTRDWRRGSGQQIADDTWTLDIPGEPEDGMTLTFLSSSQVTGVFAVFKEARMELAEHTTRQRMRLDSDWLVTAWK